MRMLIAGLFFLAATISATAAEPEQPQVSVLRVAAPAKLLHGKKPAALLPKKIIAAGDRVSTGPNGRAALAAGGGVLTLGGDTELYVHSTGSSEAADIARVVLTRGALRVEISRDLTLAPLDLRLNLGPLQLRALAADLWAAVEPRGETVCLLSGAAEILAEFGSERLDKPGDCLLFSASNRRLLLKPDADNTLAQKLERTAFATDVEAGRPVSSLAAAGPRAQTEIKEPAPAAPESIAPAPPAAAAKPGVAAEQPAAPATPVVAAARPAAPPQFHSHVPPVIVIGGPPPQPTAPEPPAPAVARTAKPEPPPPAPAPAPAAPGADESAAADLLGGGWTVVVASPSNAAGAQSYAEKLRAAKLPAEAVSGAGRHRVIVGHFATRAQAAAYRAQLQAQLQIAGAWLLQD